MSFITWQPGSVIKLSGPSSAASHVRDWGVECRALYHMHFSHPLCPPCTKILTSSIFYYRPLIFLIHALCLSYSSLMHALCLSYSSIYTFSRHINGSAVVTFRPSSRKSTVRRLGAVSGTDPEEKK